MMEFHFLRPWALAALLPLALLVWRLTRPGLGAGAWAQVVDPHLLPHLTAGGSGKRLPLGLAAAAWLLAVLALAGPTWSRAPAIRYVSPLPPLVLVVDLSRSMDADDLQPSRLGLARARLADLLDRLPPRRIAVVGFAGSAHTLLPFTDDPHLVLGLLPQLATDLPPVPGSAPEAGLDLARELLQRDDARHGEVLLVADGAAPAAAEAARRLVQRGARVSVLAVGAEHGRVADGRGGSVAVPLQEEPLRAVAAAGSGAHVDWREDGAALAEALSAGQTATAAAASDEADRVVWRDRGPLLVLALLPLGLLAFRRGWLGLVAALWLLQPPPAQAWEWRDLWLRPDQQAQRLLDQGDPLAAAELFRDPFRRGVAFYRGGDFEAAAEEFAKLNGAHAHYNRGNALVQLGRLAQAREAYRTALSLDPRLFDARFNLSLLDQKLGPDEEKHSELKQVPYRDERPPPRLDGTTQQAEDKPLTAGSSKQPQAPGKTGQGPDAASGGSMPNGTGSGERSSGGSGGGDDAPNSRDDSKSAGNNAPPPTAADKPDGASPSPSGTTGQRLGPDTATADDKTDRGSTSPAAGAPADDPATAAQAAGAGDKAEADSSTATRPEPDEAEAGDNLEARGATGSGPTVEKDEAQQALEQWLERIPDQPNRLLKELFRRQNERGRYPAAAGSPW